MAVALRGREEVCLNQVDPRVKGGLLPEVVPQGVRGFDQFY
jgi:hypothetical protein